MDSRLIYTASAHAIHNVAWLNPSFENGAWIYIGDETELQKELVFREINDHFADKVLYISWTRNGSKEALRENIELETKDILGREDFSIWDTAFKKVIQFNKNGVMRLGRMQPEEDNL